jgi:uncharacterized protein YndB with AHSA1/START domain
VVDGRGPDPPHHWGFGDLEQADRAAPRLCASAYPVSRDRWERLVTTVEVECPPESVWRALTDPEALRRWIAVCHGTLGEVGAECVLDFEDGEFFLCRTRRVSLPTAEDPGHELTHLWRWLGIGQAARVTWRIDPSSAGASVTVTEECLNPPADWQTWNGGGWPGILEQLAHYLRTGLEWRWPWRRMGPYVQVELPAPPFEAWDRLVNPAAVRFWLQRMHGTIEPGGELTIMMGDASGRVTMRVREVVDPGQSFPSFLPSIDFGLARPAWGAEVGGKLWIEPAGWGRSLLQVFHCNWEDLPGALQLGERRIVTAFWAGAMRRAVQMLTQPAPPSGPHGWS